ALFATIRSMAIDAPDLRKVDLDPVVVAGLVAAHRSARDHLHRDHPGLQVGWSVACVNAYDAEGSEGAADAYAQPRQHQFVDVAADDDFLGVQAYTRTRVAWVDGIAERVEPETDGRTLNDWEWYPAALGDAIDDVRRRVATPLIVTENGVATDDDSRRIAYTTEALSSLQRSRADGADIRGYFHWSLLDNYEWGSFGPTFGLVAVDRTTFERTPKPSLAWLGEQRAAFLHEPAVTR
ncbi:MAG: glycosyl hydrolase family protein, partial [Frankiales bacterium]|nr:glycosyl hydrolase family protein [Frankiales bacterium]